MYTFLTTNLASGIRYAVHNNRQYLVAKATIIKEGVLNGSKGPLFYPRLEIAKAHPAWDKIPITNDHPTLNGKFVSANTPGVKKQSQLGFVKNPSMTETGDRGRVELWFDVAVTNKKVPGLIDRIEAGEKVELSTGLKTFNVDQAGEWHGRAYSKTAINYSPDHLAILPFSTGACSVNDGCGVNNELSHDDIREQIREQLKDALKVEFPIRPGVMDTPYPYILQVFSSSFIYELGNDTFKRSYSYNKKTDTVTLGDDEPTKVKRKTTYETVANGDCCKGKSKKHKCKSCKESEEVMANECPVANALAESCPVANVKKKASGGCGIGPGGFQPGNKCAGGGGSGAKPTSVFGGSHKIGDSVQVNPMSLGLAGGVKGKVIKIDTDGTHHIQAKDKVWKIAGGGKTLRNLNRHPLAGTQPTAGTTKTSSKASVKKGPIKGAVKKGVGKKAKRHKA